MVAIDVTTQIGADGVRYPTGSQPTDAADYARRPVVAEDLDSYVTQDDFVEQGPSGRELAYAESAAVQSGIATATDVTGLSSGSFVVGSRPVLVEVILPYVPVASAAANVILQITDAAGVVKRQSAVAPVASGAVVQMRCVERISTPGTYQRKAQLVRFGGTGTIGNNLGATTVSTIIVTER